MEERERILKDIELWEWYRDLYNSPERMDSIMVHFYSELVKEEKLKLKELENGTETNL